MRTVAHYLGILVLIFGAVMLAPLVVSVVCAEWEASYRYILGISIALTTGSVLRLAKIDPQRMSRKHAIAITGMIWIVGAVLAAVPLYLSGHYASFLDTVFEGVSGLTATGLSLVQDVDHMSMADNMWRFTMQFVGGQGVVVVAISLGLFARTGNKLYASEGREESVVPNVMNTARFIWKFALAAVLLGTVVMTVILLLTGMEPARGFFHALWLTIGAYDTGGFAPGSLSLVSYHSWPLEIAAMLLMMIGALNFALVAQIHKGNWREFVQDIEVRTLALWTTVIVVVFVATLAVGDFFTDYSGLVRRGVFTIVSATTNTGFQVLTTGQITVLFSSGAFFLVAVAMTMGGSSASTAGGIKALRVGSIFKGIGLSVRRVLQPQTAHIATSYNHIGKHQLVPELLSSALIIAALYMLSYLIGALVGIACGYEALPAIFESISAASNAGLSSGIVSPNMPTVLKLLYILQMWLGRLEFLTLLALFGSFVASLIPRRAPQKEHAKLRRGSVGLFPAVALAVVLALTLVLAPARYARADTVEGAATSEGTVTETTISELAAMPEHLDHTMVAFEGEVVGDVMHADAEYVWVTLGDGTGAISVYLPRAYQDQIVHTGGYNYEGTRLRLMGEFHLACNQHDGGNDVHAIAQPEVISEGGPVEHLTQPLLLGVGLVLIAAAGALTLLYNHLSKRRR